MTDATTLPRLVLLPGLHGTGHLFEPLLAALTGRFPTTVIAYPAAEALSYDDLLPFVREKLPRDEPFVLLGESFSGPLAIRLAAEHPDNLRGLILVATFARTPVHWLPAWSGRYLPSFPLRLLPLWGQLRLLAAGKLSPEYRQLFLTALQSATPAVLVHRIAEVLRVDVSQELLRVITPILLIAAGQDRIVPRRARLHLKQLRPDLQVEVINTGHPVLQLEPERAAEVIAGFIRKLKEPRTE